MKAQLPWALEEADLSFCHSGGLGWDARRGARPDGQAGAGVRHDRRARLGRRARRPPGRPRAVHEQRRLRRRARQAARPRSKRRTPDPWRWTTHRAGRRRPTCSTCTASARLRPLSGRSGWPTGWRAKRPDITWACPQLPPSPAAALAGLRALTAGWLPATSAVIGSSLGGFYATVFAEETGWRALVINPAVDPARDLAAHIGRQTMYHAYGRKLRLPAGVRRRTARHGARRTPLAHPDRAVLAIVAKGDEVLDWREMTARYAHGPLKLIAGSDHGNPPISRTTSPICCATSISSIMEEKNLLTVTSLLIPESSCA